MSYPSVVSALTPSGWWRSDVSGTSLLDSSGNGHHGTLSGTYTAGQASLVNDGADTSILFGGGGASLPGIPTIGTGAFTILLWPSHANVAGGPDVMFGSSAGFLAINASKAPQSGLGGAITGSTNLCDGNPHLVAYTRTGTGAGGATLYSDNGFIEGTATDTANYAPALTWFLAGFTGVGSFPYLGKLDEAMIIVGTALSQGQIQAIWAAGTSSPSATTYTAPASPTTITTGSTTTATITPDGNYTGTITGTPSGSASTGLSAQTTSAWSGTSEAKTLSWTPTVAGTLTITWTNSGSLTNPANDTITVNAGPQTIAASDARISFSPGNWLIDGTGAITANPGADVKLSMTSGGSGYLKANLNTTNLNGLTAGNCPRLWYSVNGVGFTGQQLLAYSASPVQVTIGTGLLAGDYDFEVGFQGQNQGIPGDRWNNLKSGASAVWITGFEIDAGSTLNAAVVPPGIAVFYGDSRSEGIGMIDATVQDATQAFPRIMARQLNCRASVIAFGGQGFAQAGTNNVPAINSSYGLYSAGNSRLNGSGHLPFSPDYVFVALGTNDSSDVTTAIGTTLANMRSIAPAAKIVLCVPPRPISRSYILAAFSTFHATDSNCVLLDIGYDLSYGGIPKVTGGDRILYTDVYHETVKGHAIVASLYSRLLQAAIGGTAGVKRVSFGGGF